MCVIAKALFITIVYRKRARARVCVCHIYNYRIESALIPSRSPNGIQYISNLETSQLFLAFAINYSILTNTVTRYAKSRGLIFPNVIGLSKRLVITKLPVAMSMDGTPCLSHQVNLQFTKRVPNIILSSC